MPCYYRTFFTADCFHICLKGTFVFFVCYHLYGYLITICVRNLIALVIWILMLSLSLQLLFLLRQKFVLPKSEFYCFAKTVHHINHNCYHWERNHCVHWKWGRNLYYMYLNYHDLVLSFMRSQFLHVMVEKVALWVTYHILIEWLSTSKIYFASHFFSISILVQVIWLINFFKRIFYLHCLLIFCFIVI